MQSQPPEVPPQHRHPPPIDSAPLTHAQRTRALSRQPLRRVAGRLEFKLARAFAIPRETLS
jgi:hypothetical protein